MKRTSVNSAVARLEPKAYLGVHLAVGLVVAILGLWIFGALVDAVLANSTMVRWDVAADARIHAAMTPAFTRIVLSATQLGSPVAMAALMLTGAIILGIKKRRTDCIGWVAAFIGGALIDEALKYAVRRPRPMYGASFLHGHSFSFPSGHAMGAIIGYSMLAWMIARIWHPARRLGVLIRVLAALIILTVGVSRLLLGVHYPSDVLGGFVAGAVWVFICVAGVELAEDRSLRRKLPLIR